MTLREKLIVLRDKAGISQMSLAHQLDVSRQAVSRWESGDTTPSMDKLKALAKIYGVDRYTFLTKKCGSAVAHARKRRGVTPPNFQRLDQAHAQTLGRYL